MIELKTIEIAIVIPVKHSVGKRVGTLCRRVPEDMKLPEIIQQVRKDYKDDTEGVIFLDNNSFNETLDAYKAKREERLHKIMTESHAA